MSNILEIKNLTKRFTASRNFFGQPNSFVHAVEDVSFTLKAGEVLGLVGESGCGKSTLGRCILKLLEPDSGQIIFQGRDLTHLNQKQMRAHRTDMQIVFQDPYASLNPRLRIGEAIIEPLLIHKIVPKNKSKDRAIELLEMVGLDAISFDKYPHEFSGGQRQRIGIARALSVNPKLLIADEPVSALDVSIQAQIINLLSDLQKKLNLAMIFIAHDLKVVEHISQRIMVMYLGKTMEVIDAKNLENAQHPYTKSLLSAIPIPDPFRKKERVILKGDVPSPIHPPSGCVFHPRCPIAVERCQKEVPLLREISLKHQAACDLI